MLPQGIEDVLPLHLLVVRHESEKGVERADAQSGMIRHRNTLMRGRLRLKDDMTACLMDDAVVPVFAKCLHQVPPR